METSGDGKFRRARHGRGRYCTGVRLAPREERNKRLADFLAHHDQDDQEHHTTDHSDIQQGHF